jgi:hypothetical protein
MTKLEEVDRDQTCLLGVAGDVVMMLIHGLLGIEGVEKCLGEVESAELEVCHFSQSTYRCEGGKQRLMVERPMDCIYELWTKCDSTPTPSFYWITSEPARLTYPLS